MRQEPILRELHAVEARPRFCLPLKAKSALGGLGGTISMLDLKIGSCLTAVLESEIPAKFILSFEKVHL